MNKISNKIMFGIIVCTTTIGFILGSISIFVSKAEIEKEANEKLLLVAEKQALKIQNSFANIKILTNNLENLVLSKLPYDEVKDNVEAMKKYENELTPQFINLIKDSNNRSGWVVFDSKVISGGNTIEICDINNDGNYTRSDEYDVNSLNLDEERWWTDAIKKGENWSKPYYWELWKANIASYSRKLVYEGKTIGVVGADLNFDTLRDEISKIKIYKTGYVVLMDEKLNFLYSPEEDHKNLSEEISEKMTNNIINSKDKTNIYNFKHDGGKVLMVTYRLNNGWIVGAVPKLNEMYSGVYRMIKIVLLASITLILIFSIISLFLGRKLSKPIVDFSEKFKIGSEGDLTVKSVVNTNDEMKLLSNGFNSFFENLNDVMKNISNMANRVDKENTELEKVMDNIIKGDESTHFKELEKRLSSGILHLNDFIKEILDSIRNQTAATEESLAAIEQIASSSQIMSQLIKKESDSFKETLEMSNKSYSQIEKTFEGMQEIDESVHKTTFEIGKLKLITNDIGEITTAINSISEKTNLLALNAAIEAARAGDAGRGFAVVADEIRKLAEQTNHETSKIENLIVSIQSEVENVKIENEQVEVKVKLGLELMTSSKDSISKIRELTTDNSKEIDIIMSSAGEQEIAAREISDSISNITENSTKIEQLSINTNEIADSIKGILVDKQGLINDLRKFAAQLKEDLSFFKVV